MEIENQLDGNSNMDQPSSSKGNGPEKSSNQNGNQQDLNKKGEGKTNTVPFYKLFSFADSTDILLMVAGTIGAIGNGLSLPLMTILFGELSDSFGNNQTSSDVVKVVSKVKFCGVKFYENPFCINFVAFKMLYRSVLNLCTWQSDAV